MDRTQLFDTLSNLPTADFERLLFAVKPPGGLVPGDTAPQINRVKALLDWAEGSSGRGIDEVKHHLDQLDALLGPGQTMPDFRPYLQSILDDEGYLDWQGLYTPITVEGQKPAPSFRHSRRLKLRAETVQPPKDERLGSQTTNQQEEIEQLDVLDGLHRYAAEHVLLIGKPGSGKSTSLEWLLWNEAHNALEHPKAKIPVLVKLRRCTSTIEALIQDFFIQHHLPLNVQDIERLLQQGKVLLLLDGLNELPEAFSIEIANFRERYRKTTPMIVSTRDLSVGGTLGIVKTLKMLPLSKPQMREFVLGYLPEEGDRLFQQLKGDRLRKFAETPLLLWMLCNVFAENRKIPANLGLAFREFTQLYDRQIQEDAPVDSKDQWPKLLRHLAFALMHDKELVEFRLSMTREEAENLLTAFLRQEGRANARENAERWLQDLLDYHLIQPVIQEDLEEHIEFRHQLIQEYYAAEYLLRLLPGLSDEQLKREYLNLLKWTEAIALMLALVSDEAQALRVVKLAMDDVDLLLGARLAGEVTSTFQATTVGWINTLDIPNPLKLRCWAMSYSEVAIPGLLSALKDPGFEVRERAASALGDLGSEKAIPGLLNAIGDQYVNVNKSAVAALGQIGSEKAIEGLLNALKHQDVEVREIAAEALGKLGNEKAIEGLLNTLKHQDTEVRRIAAIVLGHLGREEAIPCLIENLKDLDSDVRWLVAIVLGQLGSEKAIPGLLNIFKDQDSYSGMRKIAAEALGQIGSEKAIEGLLNALKHQDVEVREIAAIVLGHLGREEAIPCLLNILKDQDVDACSRAAIALRKLGNEEAIPCLLNALKHQDAEVRGKAVETLGNLGNEKAISGLLNALEDKDSSVREIAAIALGKLGNEAAISGLLNALKHQDADLRWLAVIVLRKLGSKAAIPGLLNALEHQVANVRWLAAIVLGHLGIEKAIPDLLSALEDQDADLRVRWLAAEALGKVGSKEAIPGLRKALEDQDPNLHVKAANALGKIGGAVTMTYLWQLHRRQPEDFLEKAISDIQNLCQFYNYEI